MASAGTASLGLCIGGYAPPTQTTATEEWNLVDTTRTVTVS